MSINWSGLYYYDNPDGQRNVRIQCKIDNTSLLGAHQTSSRHQSPPMREPGRLGLTNERLGQCACVRP